MKELCKYCKTNQNILQDIQNHMDDYESFMDAAADYLDKIENCNKHCNCDKFDEYTSDINEALGILGN